MNIFSALSAWGDNFTRRFRLSLNNTRDNREVWYTHISPLNLLMAVVATFVVMFIVVLTFVGYTSILDVLPGYRSETLRSRQMMIDNLLRIDSMERVIDDIMLYNNNVSLIMSGNLPVSQSVAAVSDTAVMSKALVFPNGFDSTLRRSIEVDGRYNVGARGAMSMTPLTLPVDGVVTRQFDIAEEFYGVDVAVASGERILATQRGVVLMSLWSPNEGSVVQILHPNNMISIYQNISDVVVERGESVEAGAVIGYNGERANAEAVATDNRVIHFELWEGGRPLDPESYLVF